MEGDMAAPLGNTAYLPGTPPIVGNRPECPRRLRGDSAGYAPIFSDGNRKNNSAATCHSTGNP